jgi:hypothetical protein
MSKVTHASAERAEDEGDAHASAERAEDSCIALARTRRRQRSRRINPRCVTFAVGVHAGCELEGLGVAEQVEGVVRRELGRRLTVVGAESKWDGARPCLEPKMNGTAPARG